MAQKDTHERLAERLSLLGMGFPKEETLLDILRENFSPLEAEATLALPTRTTPLNPAGLEEIEKASSIPREELKEILEGLVRKGLLYAGKTGSGERGYALHQVGYGFPQTFFWKGEESPHARKMAKLTVKYFNRRVVREGYTADPKPYRYVPVREAIQDWGRAAVYPHHAMESVIDQADVLAVGHCPCRIIYRLNGRTCTHPTEVCIKFNDLARYVIDQGLAREITREEAWEIIRLAEEAGLVHFVDNTEKNIQHNCNCCGCACWNVGNIRRRKIPRDVLMATYFLRETLEEECTGCGLCAEICPVDAIRMEEESPVVDTEWCIGCGVCVTKCPTGAARIELRADRSGELPAKTFQGLHEKILKAKGLA